MAADSRVARRTQNATTPTRGARQRGADARTAVRPHAQAAAPRQGTAAARSAALGNIAKNAGAISRKSSERRRERHELRRTAAEFGGVAWLRSCGHKVCRPEGVGVRGGSGAPAGFAGLATCGSVWACPVCSARIGAARSSSLGDLLTWATTSGHTVAMLTLTARHHRGQRLADLWSSLSDAWRFLGRGWGSETEAAFVKRVEKNQAAWDDYFAGLRRKPRKTPDELTRRIGLLEELGSLGYVRAAEVTHGKSGWHVHYHCVLVLDSTKLPHGLEDRDDRLADAQSRIFALWEKGLARNGLTAVETVTEADGSTASVGADLRIMHGSEVANVLGTYLTKSTDAVAASRDEANRIAAETTLGALKKGRRSSRTPFQILADITEIGDADDADLWREWVAASRGRVQLVWSNGLAELAKVADAEKTDDEIVAEEIGTEDLFRLPADTWHAIRATSTRFDLLEAIERGGRDAGTALLESLGLHWTPLDANGVSIERDLPDEVSE